MNQYVGDECPHCREEIEDHEIYEKVMDDMEMDYFPDEAKIPAVRYETETVIEFSCGHMVPYDLFTRFRKHAAEHNELVEWLELYDDMTNDSMLAPPPRIPTAARRAIQGEIAELDIKMGRIADQCSNYVEAQEDDPTLNV